MPAIIRKITLVAILVLCLSATSYAMGFMVKPMSIELASPSGQRLKTNVEVRNTQSDRPIDIEISLAPLIQTSGGSFSVPDNPSQIDNTGHSAAGWITTKAKSLTVPSMTSGEVELEIAVPISAKGTYHAALLVQSKPERTEKGLPVVIRFLIPVIVEIDGPTLRTEVELRDVGLEQSTDTSNGKKEIQAWYQLENKGEKMVNTQAQMTILSLKDSRPHRVAQIDIPEKKVLPGALVQFSSPLSSDLPSGDYRIQSTIYADGRPIKRLTRDITLASNVSVDDSRTLELSTSFLTAEVRPGTKRNEAIRVRNTSAEEITLHPSTHDIDIYSSQENKSLSGTEMIELKEEEVRLAPGRERNFRITVVAPKTLEASTAKYSKVLFESANSQGKIIDSAPVVIAIMAPGTESKPALKGRDLSVGEDTTHGAIASFILNNPGDIHVEPKLHGRVTDGQGINSLAKLEIDDAQPVILPRETKTFFGRLPLQGLANGTYTLEVVAEYGAEREKMSTLIEVSQSKQGKIAKIMRPTN